MQDKSPLEQLEEENKQLKEELQALKDKGFSFTQAFDSEGILDDLEGEFEKIKEKTQDLSLDLKEQIKQKPLQSLSIAFAAGIFLSKILGGRR